MSNPTSLLRSNIASSRYRKPLTPHHRENTNYGEEEGSFEKRPRNRTGESHLTRLLFECCHGTEEWIGEHGPCLADLTLDL